MRRNNGLTFRNTVAIAIVLYVGMNQFQPVQNSHNSGGNNRSCLKRNKCLNFTPSNVQLFYARAGILKQSESSVLSHFTTWQAQAALLNKCIKAYL